MRHQWACHARASKAKGAERRRESECREYDGGITEGRSYPPHEHRGRRNEVRFDEGTASIIREAWSRRDESACKTRASKANGAEARREFECREYDGGITEGRS